MGSEASFFEVYILFHNTESCLEDRMKVCVSAYEAYQVLKMYLKY